MVTYIYNSRPKGAFSAAFSKDFEYTKSILISGEANHRFITWFFCNNCQSLKFKNLTTHCISKNYFAKIEYLQNNYKNYDSYYSLNKLNQEEATYGQEDILEQNVIIKQNISDKYYYALKRLNEEMSETGAGDFYVKEIKDNNNSSKEDALRKLQILNKKDAQKQC